MGDLHHLTLGFLGNPSQPKVFVHKRKLCFESQSQRFNGKTAQLYFSESIGDIGALGIGISLESTYWILLV